MRVQGTDSGMASALRVRGQHESSRSAGLGLKQAEQPGEREPIQIRRCKTTLSPVSRECHCPTSCDREGTRTIPPWGRLRKEYHTEVARCGTRAVRRGNKVRVDPSPKLTKRISHPKPPMLDSQETKMLLKQLQRGALTLPAIAVLSAFAAGACGGGGSTDATAVPKAASTAPATPDAE